MQGSLPAFSSLTFGGVGGVSESNQALDIIEFLYWGKNLKKILHSTPLKSSFLYL